MVTLHEVITFLVSMQISIRDRKSGSAGMPRPISYAVFCLKKKKQENLNNYLHNKNISTNRAYSLSIFCCTCWTLFFVIHFFFNDPATPEIYTLSLHDALPIYDK